jgi:hypothetical protein
MDALNVMDTPFGLRGRIEPVGPFEKQQSFSDGPFEVSIQEGVVEVGYQQESQAEAARTLIARYLAAFNYTNNTHHRANLNQSWQVTPEGAKAIGVSVFDQLKVTDAVLTTSVTHTADAYIVIGSHDSSHLSNQSTLLRKCQKDPALNAAVQHFSEEVIDAARPLYGIFKALEVLADRLGKKGRAKLGRLAGHDFDYVNEVMNTTQQTRHASSYQVKGRVLTEQECCARAKVLIDAYARTV